MTMQSRTESRASALPESLRSRLERAVDAYGMKRVIKATGAAEGTTWRALARGTVYASTANAFAHGLDALEREAP